MRTPFFAILRPAAAALLLGAPLVACGVVGTAFSDQALPGSGDPNGSDDAISNGDAGGLGHPAPASDAAHTPGSPLCADLAPDLACIPDDPRLGRVCGNELAPGFDAGASSSGAPPDSDDAGFPPLDEDGGPEAQPTACRVQRAEDGGALVHGCESAGRGGEGAACTLATECGAGLDCVLEPGQERGACRAYCCAGSCTGLAVGSEEAGRYCDPARKANGESRIPACLPIRSCRLLGRDECPQDQTCAVVRETDGSTGCVEAGTAQVGAPCDVDHCAAGLTCLGQVGTRTCFQLCSDAGAPCPQGQACEWSPPTFREAGLGVCTESVGQRSLY